MGPAAGAYRTERVAFSPLPVARAQTPRFIELSLITRRFNYHGELTAEPMGSARAHLGGAKEKGFCCFFWKVLEMSNGRGEIEWMTERYGGKKPNKGI